MLPDIKQSHKTWGSEQCSLTMPGYTVEFKGLSNSQRILLMNEFDAFLLDKLTSTSISRQKLECTIYRLATDLDVDSSKLEECGQYAPIQMRDGNQLKLLGYNFVAQFTTDPSDCNVIYSSLAVFNENDFNELSVVENFLRYFTAHFSVSQSGVILHSAGIVVDGEAIVFPGYSNVGKTTITRKAYAHGCPILSDDINLVMPSNIGYLAHKVPFTGEFGKTVEQNNMDRSYPLKMVALLEQGTTLKADLIEPSFAISRLFTASPFVNNDDSHLPALFDIFSDLVASVTVIKLTLTRGCEFSDIMSKVSQLECEA